jgi:hypothetical protein
MRQSFWEILRTVRTEVVEDVSSSARLEESQVVASRMPQIRGFSPHRGSHSGSGKLKLCRSKFHCRTNPSGNFGRLPCAKPQLFLQHRAYDVLPLCQRILSHKIGFSTHIGGSLFDTTLLGSARSIRSIIRRVFTYSTMFHKG